MDSFSISPTGDAPSNRTSENATTKRSFLTFFRFFLSFFFVRASLGFTGQVRCRSSIILGIFFQKKMYKFILSTEFFFCCFIGRFIDSVAADVVALQMLRERIRAFSRRRFHSPRIVDPIVPTKPPQNNNNNNKTRMGQQEKKTKQKRIRERILRFRPQTAGKMEKGSAEASLFSETRHRHEDPIKETKKS